MLFLLAVVFPGSVLASFSENASVDFSGSLNANLQNGQDINGVRFYSPQALLVDNGKLQLNGGLVYANPVNLFKSFSAEMVTDTAMTSLPVSVLFLGQNGDFLGSLSNIVSLVAQKQWTVNFDAGFSKISGVVLANFGQQVPVYLSGLSFSDSPVVTTPIPASSLLLMTGLVLVPFVRKKSLIV
jgi:hypothetical protein